MRKILTPINEISNTSLQKCGTVVEEYCGSPTENCHLKSIKTYYSQFNKPYMIHLSVLYGKFGSNISNNVAFVVAYHFPLGGREWVDGTTRSTKFGLGDYQTVAWVRYWICLLFTKAGSGMYLQLNQVILMSGQCSMSDNPLRLRMCIKGGRRKNIANSS